MSSDTLLAAERKMARALDALERDLRGIRTGRASGAMVNHILVEVYGTMTPISALAGVKVIGSSQIVIEPWDRGILKALEKAIVRSDLGLSPVVDAGAIRLNLPALTEERRASLVKQVRQRAEETRVEIRNLRREAVGDLARGGPVGADEAHREMEQLQGITTRHIVGVDRVLAAKEREVLAV